MSRQISDLKGSVCLVSTETFLYLSSSEAGVQREGAAFGFFGIPVYGADRAGEKGGAVR